MERLHDLIRETLPDHDHGSAGAEDPVLGVATAVT